MTVAKRRITMPAHWRAWFRRVADGELPDLREKPRLDAPVGDRAWYHVAWFVFYLIQRGTATLTWDGSKTLERMKPATGEDGWHWRRECEKGIQSARWLCGLIVDQPVAARAARPFIIQALQAGDALVCMEAALHAGVATQATRAYIARRTGGVTKSRVTRERNQPTHDAIVAAMRAQKAMKPQPSRTKAAKRVAKAIRNPKTGKPYTFRTVLRIAEKADVRW